MTRSSFLDTVKKEQAAKPQQRGSVLSTQEKASPVLTGNPLQRSPVYAPAPLEPVEPQKFQITEEHISKLGANAAEPLQGITRQILASVKGSGDDVMSQNIKDMVKTLKGLNPDQISKRRGFLSKLFGRAQNMIEDLKAELVTAETQLDTIGQQIHAGIKKAEKRKQELEVMAEQNKQFGNNLDREYQVGLTYLEQLTSEKESFISQGADEDAATVQKLIDRCEYELAEVKAYRLVAANNVPKIEGMIMSVENLKKSGTNTLTKMMPVYMTNYAQYIISLETKGSAEMLDSVNTDFNQGLVEGSNLAHENLVTTTKLQNKQSISIESMRVMHENMMKGFDELDAVASEARTSRVAYVAELQNMEKELTEKRSKHS